MSLSETIAATIPIDAVFIKYLIFAPFGKTINTIARAIAKTLNIISTTRILRISS